VGKKNLREHKPDLLLLDVGMPEIDGIELLEKIREDEDVKDVKVIMYSALSDPRLMDRAAELGATDYLLKGGGWERVVAPHRSASSCRKRELDADQNVARASPVFF